MGDCPSLPRGENRRGRRGRRRGAGGGVPGGRRGRYAGGDAAARICVEAGDSETESQFDLRVRERPLDSRPAGAAWADRGLSKYYSAGGVSGGSAVSGVAGGRGGCECASLEDRGPVSAVDGA